MNTVVIKIIHNQNELIFHIVENIIDRSTFAFRFWSKTC